jgi:hypothetical protein
MPCTRSVPARSRTPRRSTAARPAASAPAWPGAPRGRPGHISPCRADHGRMRAERQRLEHRHRRAHAEGARDVAGGRHHAALAAADDDRLVGELGIVALLDGGVERVAIDGRASARAARGAAPGAASRRRRIACREIEIAEAVPAKAGGPIGWRGCGHGTSRSHCGISPAPGARRRCWSDEAARLRRTPFTVASSRSTKSSTLTRNCGSARRAQRLRTDSAFGQEQRPAARDRRR